MILYYSFSAHLGGKRGPVVSICESGGYRPSFWDYGLDHVVTETAEFAREATPLCYGRFWHNFTLYHLVNGSYRLHNFVAQLWGENHSFYLPRRKRVKKSMFDWDVPCLF